MKLENNAFNLTHLVYNVIHIKSENIRKLKSCNECFFWNNNIGSVKLREHWKHTHVDPKVSSLSAACMWKVTSRFIGCTSTCFNNYSFISVTLYVDESKEKFKVLFAFRIVRVIFLSLVELVFSSTFRLVMSCITC